MSALVLVILLWNLHSGIMLKKSFPSKFIIFFDFLKIFLSETLENSCPGQASGGGWLKISVCESKKGGKSAAASNLTSVGQTDW